MDEEWTAIEKLNAKTKSGKDKHGEIYIKKDRLLKPCQCGKRTKMEVEAFTFLARTELAKFIPRYWGTTKYNGGDYLEMENLFYGMEEPYASCDIKMGRKTYSDSATDEKKAKEAKKVFPGKCSELGFRAVGLSCLDHTIHHTDIVSRQDLTKKEFINLILKKLFSSSTSFDGQLSDDINYFISELQKILQIMKSGYGGILRASSLLLARQITSTSSRNIIKLIDFAHFTPTTEVDTNFVEGLEALLECFYELMDAT